MALRQLGILRDWVTVAGLVIELGLSWVWRLSFLCGLWMLFWEWVIMRWGIVGWKVWCIDVGLFGGGVSRGGGIGCKPCGVKDDEDTAHDGSSCGHSVDGVCCTDRVGLGTETWSIEGTQKSIVVESGRGNWWSSDLWGKTDSTNLTWREMNIFVEVGSKHK
jgi:hypothetical protein